MPDHQEENTFVHLTVDEQKRLDKLSHSWAKEDKSLFSDSAKLTAFDLKLLLLHFAPLKALFSSLPTSRLPKNTLILISIAR